MNAIVPGSFDPITLGHINIVERASKMFDKVFVAVMNNDSAKYDKSLKSKTYMFEPEERLELVKRSIAHVPNAVAIYYEGMLIDACDELEAYAIVRGVRNAKDMEYELIHANWNRAHNDKVEPMFLPAESKFDCISSTFVREIIENNKNLDELEGKLHPLAIEYLKNRA